MSEPGFLVPRRWFESRRHARRRFQQRFAEKYAVTTLPSGEKVATLRPVAEPVRRFP